MNLTHAKVKKKNTTEANKNTIQWIALLASSILPVRYSRWVTPNTFFTKCWKLNTMFKWIVNIVADILLLQNITQIQSFW